MRLWLHSSHWSPISLVPHCNPFYPVLIGPPSHWSPMLPFLPCSHWSLISLVPQCDPDYTVLIGAPSHWLPLVTLPTLLSLVLHFIGPISGPKGSVLSTPQLLDPSMKDWYQYQPWNHTHRAQLTYHKAECYQIAEMARPNGRWSISGLYGWDFVADIDINPSSMDPIFGVWIGPTVGVPKWTIRHWAAAIW